MEQRENTRLVSRDYLDGALGRLEARVTGRLALLLVTALLVQTGLVLTGVSFLLTHFKA